MNLNLSPSFIEIYDKVLSSEDCERLISQFEKSPRKEGVVLSNGKAILDHKSKKSLEVYDTRFSKPSVISSVIRDALDICYGRYKEKYSIFNSYVKGLVYEDGYTFKKFEGEDAGYKRWHKEHGSSDIASKRVLVWAFYLNDSAGTDFMFYPNVRAKRGRGVIFPASFNYMHRSSPNKGIKYLVTGWITYRV